MNSGVSWFSKVYERTGLPDVGQADGKQFAGDVTVSNGGLRLPDADAAKPAAVGSHGRRGGDCGE